MNEIQGITSSRSPDILRKVGRFTIPGEWLITSPEMIRAIMGHMIIIRAEHLWPNDTFEYVALSDLFRSVEKGVVPPEYCIEVDTDTNEVTVEEVTEDE